MVEVERLIEEYNIHDVRKHAQRLSEACPVAAVNPEFSPEKIAVLAEEDLKGLLKSQLIWECLTCGLCLEATGGEVNMSHFIRDMRAKASDHGFHGTETHGGMLITMQRLSTKPMLKPERTSWITEQLQVESRKGKYLYWVGGAPFFDAQMPELKPTAIDSARAAIQLLNKLGIKPVVLEDERFSGHDLLWTGDNSGFRSLADQNLMAIRKSGAKMVIVSSPEDYYTLVKSYGEYCGGLDFEVCHITEFIARNLSELKFCEWKKLVTYHDPCRLGRGMGVYDAPRDIIRAIPGVKLVEMENTRELSSCCGTSCWTNCNRYSKLIQINRLREAIDVGADALVTTCWECVIHFRCATRPQAWRQVFIDIRDLIVLIASLLKG